MELRHLRYFVAVAEELSFIRAAARLRLAQPSLSAQIRALEEEMGVTLLDRSRNHVLLTDAGRVFLAEAQELLARADSAVKRAREASHGLIGELRIGTVAPLSMSFLPASLAAFHRAYPEIAVTVKESALLQLARGVADGQLHLAFIPMPQCDRKEMEKLSYRLLLSSPILAVLNPRHPLASQPDISIRDLRHETFLQMRIHQSDGHRRWMESVCKQAGFKPRFGAEAESPEGLASMVALGGGVSMLARFSERPPTSGYVFRPIREAEIRFELMAFWNPNVTSKMQENFLKIASAEAAIAQAALVPEKASKVKRESKMKTAATQRTRRGTGKVSSERRTIRSKA